MSDETLPELSDDTLRQWAAWRDDGADCVMEERAVCAREILRLRADLREYRACIDTANHDLAGLRGHFSDANEVITRLRAELVEAKRTTRDDEALRHEIDRLSGGWEQEAREHQAMGRRLTTVSADLATANRDRDAAEAAADLVLSCVTGETTQWLDAVREVVARANARKAAT